MITELSSTTGDLVKAVLDVSLLRHKIIANNIANQNTPGHISQKVDFETVLAAELGQSNALENDAQIEELLNFVQPDIVDREESITADSPDKALDLEMAEMAKNTLKYEALIRGLGKLSDLKSMAISGGKG